VNILAINCGSSTLKFRLFELEPSGADRPPAVHRRAAGLVDRIGARSALEFEVDGGERLAEEREVPYHADATRLALDWLRSVAPGGIDAIGHRVVHGGPSFLGPVLLDDAVIAAIEAVSELAPLHNAGALSAIRGARAALGPAVPMVATFDTAFFRGMPERATHYAIPRELAEQHGVRRYGFHGLAHRYMAERYAALTSQGLEQVRLITLQLGNGCSATATGGGRPLDTSMGFTPLEGLVMGTRSGDVDPAVVAHLAETERAGANEVVEWLNFRSGLLGVSGRSSDMRELLAAEAAGDAQAALAVDLFCYRVKKYIGAYLAVLGGADAIVFGGGIGENAPAIRARICAGMEWCGVLLDAGRNGAAIAAEERISADDSRVAVYVLPVDEELIIARDTADVVWRRGRRER
jgi:acetate kinase